MPAIDFATGKPLQRAEQPAPFTAPRKPAARKRSTLAQETRKALLAKVHVAKKQLGMTEAEYRGMLEGNFGCASAGDLCLTDLKRFVLLLAEYGFKPTKGSARRRAARKKAVPANLQPGAYDPLATKQLLEKIEAQLTEKGRVEGTHVPWGYAVAILKQQSGGVTRCFEHATADQLRGVIAALTRDARRKGRRAY